MEAAEAQVHVQKAIAELKKVDELADSMLQEDIGSIINDLEMLESELQDVTDAADEATEVDE